MALLFANTTYCVLRWISYPLIHLNIIEPLFGETSHFLDAVENKNLPRWNSAHLPQLADPNSPSRIKPFRAALAPPYPRYLHTLHARRKYRSSWRVFTVVNDSCLSLAANWHVYPVVNEFHPSQALTTGYTCHERRFLVLAVGRSCERPESAPTG